MPHPPEPASTTLPTTLEALSRGHLHILPTTPAARALRHAYNLAQQAAGLKAWEPPPVLSWSQFLETLWSDAILNGLETRLLLNPLQETALWMDVISRAQSSQTLTTPDSQAALAAEAWYLAHAFNITDRLRSTANTHDSRTFAAWAQSFQSDCDRNACLTPAALASTLAQHIAAATLKPPPSLTLLGFQTLNPSQSNLLQTISNAGSSITHITLTSESSTTPNQSLLTAPSTTEELRQVALYLRTFIQSSPTPPNIAVLLTDPSDAPELDATFRDILAPELQSILADTSSKPWEFLTGDPLPTLPLIAVALDLATWADSPLELPRITALLLSPYLGNLADLDASAQFDANILRQARLLRPELTLPAVLRLSSSAPAWLSSLNQFLSTTNLTTPGSFADWAEFTRSLLAAANWPGQRPLTSLEFHATQSWDSLLDQLSTLDFRGRRVPYATFLHTLTGQAATTPFTPPSTHAPIQIMSPSAAIGQTFDAIILTRATDANYPPTPQPNPLLSWHLQSSLEMPGTSQSRTTELAQQSLTTLLASTPHTLVTYTPETPDGTQRLSPLIAQLNLPQLTPLPDSKTPLTPTTLYADTDALPPLPQPHVRGGARVLQLQAACGFQAFATMRLQATELESRDAGFDARETGNLLHRTLQKFWSHTPSQAALNAMSPEDRRTLLTRCIDESIDYRLIIDSAWDNAYLQIQKQRLLNLLTHWLDEELRRGPFTILHLEHEQPLNVGPLHLTLRVDRLDAVADGVFLVDYKTGYAAKQDNWLGERPDEPQLPLYALLPEAEHLKGLAFAKVRAGKDMKWLGFQSELGLIPSKKTEDLSTQIAEWRNILTALAEDFAAGNASVNPKDYPNTCTHCTQRLLCRLDPITFLATEPDDDTHNTEEDDINV